MSLMRITFPKNKVELGKSGSEDFIQGKFALSNNKTIPANMVKVDEWYPPFLVILRSSDDYVSLQDDSGNVITVEGYYLSIPNIGVGEVVKKGNNVELYVYPKVVTTDYLVNPKVDYDKLQHGEESKVCKMMEDDGFPFVLESLYELFGLEEEDVTTSTLSNLLKSALGESSNE